MRDSVRRNFIEFTAPFEGRLHYMYLDALVTTGVGNLIDSVAAAQALPWQVGDGPVATADQVRTEWEMVKSRQDLRDTPAERAADQPTPFQLAGATVRPAGDHAGHATRRVRQPAAGPDAGPVARTGRRAFT